MGFNLRKSNNIKKYPSQYILNHLLIALIYLLVYRIVADITTDVMNIKSGPSTVATLFFPAAGITIAFLLYFDIWLIPLIPINIIYETITKNRPEFVVLYLPLIITIGYGGCGIILKRILKIDPNFKTLRDGLYYIVVTISCSLFVGITYSFIRAINNPKTAPTLVSFGIDFFIGDIAGILSLTPFLTVILFPAFRKIISNEFDYNKLDNYIKKFLAILVSTIIWTVAIFSQTLYAPNQILFLFVIPLVTIAIFSGLRGSILANILIIFEVITILNFDGSNNLFEFQVAILSLSSIALIIGVVISERQEYLSKVEELIHDRTMKLEEANQNLEFFSYSVSHDLRAPLTNINNSIDLILDEYTKIIDSNVLEIISRMKTNSERMDVLTTDLLNFFKLSRKFLTIFQLV